jgi:hypothetical protein
MCGVEHVDGTTGQSFWWQGMVQLCSPMRHVLLANNIGGLALDLGPPGLIWVWQALLSQWFEGFLVHLGNHTLAMCGWDAS